MSERLGPKQISLKEKDHVVKLIQREQKAWELKDIPPPPDALFEVLNRANEKGYTTLEPHYFPERKFTEDSDWIGCGIKPEKNSFWWYIRKGYLPENAATLYKKWILIDSIQLYPENPNDGLGQIIQRFINDRPIEFSRYKQTLNPTSRLNISLYNLTWEFKEMIAQIICVQDSMIRLPRFIEWNVLGNLHYPEWGDTPESEWFYDEIGATENKRFIRVERDPHIDTHAPSLCSVAWHFFKIQALLDLNLGFADT